MNLLLIMSDEHRRQVMGCYGNALAQTPHLDALAARGARFANAACNVPICVPSRAAFVTGRYGHQIGSWDNAAPYTGIEASSWGHRLLGAGDHVTTIGKLHFRQPGDPTGFADQRIPMHVMHGVGDLFGCIRWDMPRTRHQLEVIRHAGPGESEYIRYDRAIAAAAVAWLQHEAPRHAAPWCLWVSFTLPHFPLVVPPPYFERYPPERVPLPIQWDPSDWPAHPHLRAFRETRVQTPAEHVGEAAIRRAIATYYGMCTFLDEQIGRVLGALRATGLDRSTRILYTSDHGEMLGDYGCWGKHTMYDSDIAVPLILAGPEVPPGGVVDQHVSLVDAFPTILDAFGIPPASGDGDLPGRSLWPAAQGEAFPQRSVFAEYHATGSESAVYLLRDARYKLVHYAGYAPQLFDLVTDRAERHDLAADAAHADALRRLEAELRRLVDPEGLDAAAKADQRRRLALHGGEAAIRAAGPQIAFTRAPEEFR
ncbi:MAG: sulfatase-like hydrolase/transferase [Actinobacteria bacterium]|nr:sulfatase-like hydrolase/transferase [Actinomycetota bacterium]